MRDAQGRLYAAFDAALVLAELKGTTVLLDEEAVSASSGKKIHRLVVKKPGWKFGVTCRVGKRSVPLTLSRSKPMEMVGTREERLPPAAPRRDKHHAKKTPPGGTPGGAFVRSYLAHIRLRGARTNRSGY